MLKFSAVVASVAVALSNPTDFVEYAKAYGKSYSGDEVYHRQQIFESSLKEIKEINSRNGTWTAGLNKFSDMTWDEFRSAYLITEPQDCSATGTHVKSEGPLPDSVDWRTKNVVTRVKDQGQCGSCWTFSSTGAVESAHAIATGHLPYLSEQQLIDCAGNFDNHGCEGGLPSHAFQYIMYNGGLDTEDAYPYEGKDASCRFSKAGVGARLKNEVNITEGADAEVTDAVANVGPVSVAYEVVSDFKHYKSGVYQSTECKNGPMDVNHAVLAVGYGTEDHIPYYLVKNSWGTGFGIDGYFKIIRGKNMCGISTCASYPISA